MFLAAVGCYGEVVGEDCGAGEGWWANEGVADASKYHLEQKREKRKEVCGYGTFGVKMVLHVSLHDHSLFTKGSTPHTLGNSSPRLSHYD